MRTLAALALGLATFVAAVAAQTSATFTGTWEGTVTMQRGDGTAGDSDPIVFVLAQKGDVLTGKWGPADRQNDLPIAKGVVKDGTATFEVQEPNGTLFKFTLQIVKERLQGEITGERNGVVRGRAKVDAARSK